MNNYNKLWMTIQMKLFVIVTLIGKCQVLLHSARPYANYLGLTKWIPFLVFLLSKAIWSHDESKSLPFSDWSNIGGQQQKPWNIDSGLIAFCSAYLNFFFNGGNGSVSHMTSYLNRVSCIRTWRQLCWGVNYLLISSFPYCLHCAWPCMGSFRLIYFIWF